MMSVRQEGRLALERAGAGGC
ncbi:MAG: hypothetical protein Q605_AUC00775G0002, partial [Actinomyces urogenitalis DORA_12]